MRKRHSYWGNVCRSVSRPPVVHSNSFAFCSQLAIKHESMPVVENGCFRAFDRTGSFNSTPDTLSVAHSHV